MKSIRVLSIIGRYPFSIAAVINIFVGIISLQISNKNIQCLQANQCHIRNPIKSVGLEIPVQVFELDNSKAKKLRGKNKKNGNQKKNIKQLLQRV